MLLVSQQPVVERDQFGSEMMRFFDARDDPHGVRFTFDKALDAATIAALPSGPPPDRKR